MKTDSSIAEIFVVDRKAKVVRPLFTCGVSAGFPSPAEDHIDQKLDLNEFLIPHPTSTFFVRVAGDSMVNASINNNDILIVDRSLEATNGKIIIAVLNGEMTVKRFIRKETSCQLVAENSDYQPIEITENSNFEVWGVVTSVIHQFA